MPADITRRGGAEHGIRDGVAQDVGVGMSREAVGERHQDAAEHQRSSLDQTMQIVPGPDAAGPAVVRRDG